MVNFLLILGLERREREEETPHGSRDPTPTSSFPQPGLATTPLRPWGSSGHPLSSWSHSEPPRETLIYFPLGKFQCPRWCEAAGQEETRGAQRDTNPGDPARRPPSAHLSPSSLCSSSRLRCRVFRQLCWWMRASYSADCRSWSAPRCSWSCSSAW